MIANFDENLPSCKCQSSSTIQIINRRTEVKLVEVEEVKEWEVDKILNERKIQGIVKYLVCWKGFTAEHNSWKREEDLENVKKVVAEFEERVNVEVRGQKKLEERDFRRGKLPGKYTMKILYRQDDRKFEKEYLRKLKKNQ